MANRKVNGNTVDGVWFDEATKYEPLALEIQRNMYVQRGGYRMWAMFEKIHYLLLVFLGVGGGALGLSGTLSVLWVSLLLLGVSALAIIANLLKVESNATAYEAAVQHNQAARTEYAAGDKEEARRLLQHAIALTTPRF